MNISHSVALNVNLVSPNQKSDKENQGRGGSSRGAVNESSCIGRSIFNGNNFNVRYFTENGNFPINSFFVHFSQILDDADAAIVYSNDWKIITGDKQAGDFTQHQTNVQNSTIFASFTGTC